MSEEQKKKNQGAIELLQKWTEEDQQCSETEVEIEPIRIADDERSEYEDALEAIQAGNTSGRFQFLGAIKNYVATLQEDRDYWEERWREEKNLRAKDIRNWEQARADADNWRAACHTSNQMVSRQALKLNALEKELQELKGKEFEDDRRLEETRKAAFEAGWYAHHEHCGQYCDGYSWNSPGASQAREKDYKDYLQELKDKEEHD